MTTEKELPGAPSAADAVFARRDTDVVKGAAIVLLLCHHLYMGILPAPMSLFGNSPGVVFATLSKVCVAVFALLSGYGLALSYGRRDRGSLRFTAEHVLGLMKPYWLIYLLFFVLTTFAARDGRTPLEVYGRGLRGTLAALIEFLALRPAFGTGALNQTWWYMEAALVLYLLPPAVRRRQKSAVARAAPVRRAERPLLAPGQQRLGHLPGRSTGSSPSPQASSWPSGGCSTGSPAPRRRVRFRRWPRPLRFFWRAPSCGRRSALPSTRSSPSPSSCFCARPSAASASWAEP